jgi:hypothetical protein
MYPPSTLFTTIPHDKLKTRLKETLHEAFSLLKAGMSNNTGKIIMFG